MSTPIAIKQFSISQYDVANGTMACTAISMVAAAQYLRAHGKTRKCLWSDEKAAEIIRRGVRLHSEWVQSHGNGNAVALVSPDEMAQLDFFSQNVRMGDCLFGQYRHDALGLTLAQAVMEMTADLKRTKGKHTSAYVLTTQAHSTMIGVRRCYDYAKGDGSVNPNGPYAYKFTVFDSHTRDRATGLYIKTGKAVTVRLYNPEALLGYLARLYDTPIKPNEPFTLHEVKLTNEDTSSVRSSQSERRKMDTVVAASTFDVEKVSFASSIDSDNGSTTSSILSSASQSESELRRSSTASSASSRSLAVRFSKLLSLGTSKFSASCA